MLFQIRFECFVISFIGFTNVTSIILVFLYHVSVKNKDKIFT